MLYSKLGLEAKNVLRFRRALGIGRGSGCATINFLQEGESGLARLLVSLKGM